MTDNKNIFTNNKKSDSQNVKDNLLIDELDTYSDYVHEFSDSYKNRKEEFLRSLESVNEHKATGKENTVIKNFNNNTNYNFYDFTLSGNGKKEKN